MTGLVPCSSSSSRNSALSYALSPSMHFGGSTLRIRRSATGQSCASPPVNRMAIRRPLKSASACIFVLRPPRERPTACFCSPLFHPLPSGALSRAWSRSCAYVRSQQVPGTGFPRRAPRPAHKAVIDRCRRTILGRAIASATAALQHVHNAADDAGIVHPLDAPDIPRQVGFDPLPLLIAEPKQVPAHDPNPLPKRIGIVIRAEKLMSSDPSQYRKVRLCRKPRCLEVAHLAW